MKLVQQVAALALMGFSCATPTFAEDPEYVKDREGKWVVRFGCRGYPGQFYVVEADAGTGVITRAYNGTI